METQVTHFRAVDTSYSELGWRDMYRFFSRQASDRPERGHFGVLHVFNSGTIDPQQGYPMHPHDNVEIVTIPFRGTWEHRDTVGNVRQFGAGSVQSITAGTGLAHSEFNASATDSLTTMQFWLFTRKRGVAPRYDLYDYASVQVPNELTQIASPHDDEGVRIEQDAWFHIGRFDGGRSFTYSRHLESNGIFIYVTRGEFEVMDYELGERDALGIEGSNIVTGQALSQGSEVLLIEVPMVVDPNSLYF